MAKSVDDFNKKRLRSSNVTVAISISLVLFFVGLFSLILINARKYSDHIKEQLIVSAYFDESESSRVSEKLSKLQKQAFDSISKLYFVKNATFISKKEAVQNAKKSLGINTDILFEDRIFPASIEISVKSNYVNPESINTITKELYKIPGIKDVKSDIDLTIEVYNNLNKILTWILIIAVIFLVIAILLINSSIRLKIFSKRFTIKTMQLVGAQRNFILKPFVNEAILLGIVSSAISLLFLLSGWYYFTLKIGLEFISDSISFAVLVIFIFSIGIIITVISTIFATWKFLKTRVEDLYYS